MQSGSSTLPEANHATADAMAQPGHGRARHREDTARFIERFEALTGHQVHSTSTEGLPREFLARVVQTPDLLVEQYGYELEPRTYNALCRYEPGRHHGPWNFRHLLEVRGFGVFSLLDLLEVLARHGISFKG